MTYTIGDLVWYVIPPGMLPARPVWAAAVVVSVRGRRVGILTVLSPRPRYVTARRLADVGPPADVDAYWQCPDKVPTARRDAPRPRPLRARARMARSPLPGIVVRAELPPPRSARVARGTPEVTPGGYQQK